VAPTARLWGTPCMDTSRRDNWPQARDALAGATDKAQPCPPRRGRSRALLTMVNVVPSAAQLTTSLFRSSDTSVYSERKKLLSGREGIFPIRPRPAAAAVTPPRPMLRPPRPASAMSNARAGARAKVRRPAVLLPAQVLETPCRSTGRMPSN
jgi:hypothetical protein